MNGSVDVDVRAAQPDDAKACAEICYSAFGGVADRRGFPPDFPNLAYTKAVISQLIADPDVFAVVAETGGRVVGSNFLDRRDPVFGIGPISVSEDAQGSGAGRALMEVVIAQSTDAPSVRLLQDAHNPVSLSLYASLGFKIKEPVAMMAGRPSGAPERTLEVRPLAADDIDLCSDLCEHVLGYRREGALRQAMPFSPYVGLVDGGVRAYASSLTMWAVAHGVAEAEEDMYELVLGFAAADERPLSLLVPLRSGFFHWCLEQGLRTVKVMNVMAIGRYQDPRGCWFPSSVY
jgi:predicted N-acetyltransferase YhbS